MTITQIFIRNAKQIAKQRGIKIGTIEKEAGITVGYLARVEKAPDRGNRGLSMEIVAKIAKYLNLSIDYLINPQSYYDVEKKNLCREADELMTRLTEIEQRLREIESV